MNERRRVVPQRFFVFLAVLTAALSLSALSGCGKKPREPATAQVASQPERVSPPPAPTARTERPPTENRSDLAALDAGSDILSKSLEALNAESPLADIHFEYDSANLTNTARERLSTHARWLLAYPSIQILIEGHCDERGTVEYNLALGDRRAQAAYNYLVSLGVPTSRMKTISYGKEFPLDPGHNEEAWVKNRRDRFLITAK
jgi:peptidoglycan-associated lipoprotein